MFSSAVVELAYLVFTLLCIVELFAYIFFGWLFIDLFIRFII